MRIVLDTNILISFLLTRGETLSSIFDAWETKKFTLLISEEIFLEVRQVLTRFVDKNLISGKEAQALFRRLKKEAKLIEVESIVRVSKDRSDNRFLACAKDGRAGYLVSGDKKHLLPLKKFAKTKIVSPREFVKILG